MLVLVLLGILSYIRLFSYYIHQFLILFSYFLRTVFSIITCTNLIVFDFGFFFCFHHRAVFGDILFIFSLSATEINN